MKRVVAAGLGIGLIYLFLGTAMYSSGHCRGNQISFRQDGIMLVNGKPIFPLGVWHEYDSEYADTTIKTRIIITDYCGIFQFCEESMSCDSTAYDTCDITESYSISPFGDTLCIRSGECYDYYIDIDTTIVFINSLHLYGYDTLGANGFNMIELPYSPNAYWEGSRNIITVSDVASVLPNEHYHNPDNAQRIIQECEEHGIYIMADWVPYLNIADNIRYAGIHDLINSGIDSASCFLGWQEREESNNVSPQQLDSTMSAFANTTDSIRAHDNTHAIHYNFYPLGYTGLGWDREEMRDSFITMGRRFAEDEVVIGCAVYTRDVMNGQASLLFGNESGEPMRQSMVTDYADLFVDSIGGDTTPVWMILESFHTKVLTETLSDTMTYRDARFQAYSSIIEGVDGLIWYGWAYSKMGYRADLDLYPNEITWGKIKDLVRTELKPLNDVLCAFDSEDTLAIVNTNTQVIWRLKDFGGYYYLFAANRADSNGSASISGLIAANDSAEVMFENRKIALSSNGILTDTYAPYDVHVYKIFKTRGVVSGNCSWGAGTYKLTGDITIDTGATVTVAPGVKFIALQNTDSSQGGTNTSKTELIVKGHLRAVGTSSNKIQFKAATDTTAAWYGIRVIDNGSADIRGADIRNAYIGYKNTSANTTIADTLQNVAFYKCKPYGAWLGNKNMKVSDLYVLSDLSTVSGLHLDSVSYEVANCGFDSVKYAIEIDDGAPTIRNCWTESCKYSVWVDKGQDPDTALIYGGWFYEQAPNGIGVTVGSDYTKFRIDSCLFENQKAYGILNIYNSSQGIVRRSEFITGVTNTVYDVYAKGQNTNLGLSYVEDSLNFFHLFGMNGVRMYHIYNSGTNTLYAVSCCFENYPEQRDSIFYGPKLLAGEYDLSRCWENYSGGRKASVIPISLSLECNISQNYPNPFNPTTTIAYSVPSACDVTIKIYNILGQVVTTLVDEYKAPGEYTVVWDGNDADGRTVASGMYFYQMTAGEYVSAKKMVMLK